MLTTKITTTAPFQGGGLLSDIRYFWLWNSDRFSPGFIDYLDLPRSGASPGDVLTFGGVYWGPAAPSGGGGTSLFVIENRTSDPGSPAIGQIWLRTDL